MLYIKKVSIPQDSEDGQFENCSKLWLNIISGQLQKSCNSVTDIYHVVNKNVTGVLFGAPPLSSTKVKEKPSTPKQRHDVQHNIMIRQCNSYVLELLPQEMAVICY